MTTEKMCETSYLSMAIVEQLCRDGANGEKTGFIGVTKNKRNWIIPQHYFDFIENLESKGNVRLSIRLYNIRNNI